MMNCPKTDWHFSVEQDQVSPNQIPGAYVSNPLTPSRFTCTAAGSHYELEPLRQMLAEKNLYGLLVIDLSGAWWGFLNGNRIEPPGHSTSSIPQKQRKGGQSSARFQRLREIAVKEYYSRVGHHVSETFLQEKNFFLRFGGVLVGGPGRTKEDFLAGHFLHHEIQKQTHRNV